MLDNRLKMCAEFVSGEGIACDVGTDHAYLAAELILSGKCSRVIASDVKEGPLESARNTVEKNGISDKVELILSDGLENVPLDGVTDIIIAGMGGETIAKIISDSDSSFEGIRLILQPMTKAEILRRELYRNGFDIVQERIVEDGDKMYVIICAENSGEWRKLTEFESLYGFFDENDPLAEKYRDKESKRLAKISESLEAAGKQDEAQHYAALAYKMANGTDTVKTECVYSYLDELYPFGDQEKWDNSGLLVENMDMECSKILLTLDITNDAVDDAEELGAELIISHHPVIFDPIRRISRNSPVFRLISADIAAICAHTNLDIADGGINSIILRRLSEQFESSGAPEPFEEVGDGRHFGWIIELKEAVSPDILGEAVKGIFGCEYVRVSRVHRMIKRIAFCSGSGGSMLDIALSKNCDAYITGDIKHDVWIDANNYSLVLYDCGHFHTENIVLTELRRVLEKKFPQIDIEISDYSADPVIYM